MEMNDSGVWEEKKIWETSDWEFIFLHNYNQYGLVVYGQFFSTRAQPDGPPSIYEIVVIKENGEVEKLDIEPEGEYIFMDDGYLLSDVTAVGGYVEQWKLERAVTSVSLYDYAGNKKGTYQLADEELIDQGYLLMKLLYDNGVITGFYIQEGTDELYISQVETKEH